MRPFAQHANVDDLTGRLGLLRSDLGRRLNDGIGDLAGCVPQNRVHGQIIGRDHLIVSVEGTMTSSFSPLYDVADARAHRRRNIVHDVIMCKPAEVSAPPCPRVDGWPELSSVAFAP